MSDVYANKLETWFSSTPSLVQEVLHEPFKWATETLRAVAGDPPKLLAAADEYVRIADALQFLGRQQSADRNALAGRWSDDAFLAFSMRIDELDGQIDGLAEATRQVKGLLDQGAQACVEGADMIIDLITSLIMAALATIAVNVALSVITLGTSLAAGVAEIMAEITVFMVRVAKVLERVAKVLSKVTQVLERLVATLNRIQKSLEKVVSLLNKLEKHLNDAKQASKTAQGFQEKLKAKAAFSAQNGGVSLAIKAGTFGVVDPPTAGGAGKSAGESYISGVLRGNDAVHVVDSKE